MPLEFNYKYKDYEVRACPKHLIRLSDSDENEAIDFVKWETTKNGEPYCFSIAYWRKNEKDGTYSLCFVEDRFVRYVNQEDVLAIWKILTMAQTTLDEWRETTKEAEE